MQNIFINSFPFSKQASEHLRELEIDIRTLPENFPNSFHEAYNRLISLIEMKDLPEKINTSLTSPEVIVYAIMRVFIEILNDEFIRNRFAVAYSKRTEKLLLASKLSKYFESLAKNTFLWVVEDEEHTITRTTRWKIKFYNFLETAPSFMANDWKLINQAMIDGWVFLTEEKLIRLIAEKTKLYILNRRIPQSEMPTLPASYDSYLDTLNTRLAAQRKQYESQRVFSNEVIKKAYPPCVNETLAKAKSGENLAHPERLFLTFFLLNIGHSVSEVVDIFKNQPDFNEEMTHYQVEFADGKRGGGTKYTSFGCPKLLSYGICKRELDSWCSKGVLPWKNPKPIKNPLVYYKAKIFLMEIDKSKEKEDKSGEKNG
ncbi:MAG: hypothetical protein EU536_01885 [Promethearchaeota archaeon]|nr:MAG: hypothetical protein EU536_01885 [Candidatus Lokiarchaeota archaeon]